jgi:hypothetical protein
LPQPGQYDPAKEKYWRQTIAAWRDSGLSKSQFCRHHGIKLNLLSNWTRRLDERDAQANLRRPVQRAARRNGNAQKARTRRNVTPVSSGVDDPAGFVEVNVSPDHQASCDYESTGLIEISCPSGVVIKLPPLMETDKLLTVLHALAGGLANVL